MFYLHEPVVHMRVMVASQDPLYGFLHGAQSARPHPTDNVWGVDQRNVRKKCSISLAVTQV